MVKSIQLSIHLNSGWVRVRLSEEITDEGIDKLIEILRLTQVTKGKIIDEKH